VPTTFNFRNAITVGSTPVQSIRYSAYADPGHMTAEVPIAQAKYAIIDFHSGRNATGTPVITGWSIETSTPGVLQPVPGTTFAGLDEAIAYYFPTHVD
jgi:hypothetical protein